MPLRFRVLPSDDTRPAGPGGRGAPAGPLVERDVELPDAARELRIGRRPDVELPLPFGALSGVHARVSREGARWLVEDLGSTNGTWLGGEQLPPGERRPLVAGAELRLGNVRLRFEGEGPASAEAHGTATIARRLVDDLFATRGAPALRLPPARVLPLATVGASFVVGRADTCAVSLPLDELSREHAEFVRREAGVFVRDLGSKNGVVVAGGRVVGERALSDGDVVHLGPIALTFDDPATRYLRELEHLAPEPAPAPEPPPVTVPPVVAPPVVAAPAPLTKRTTFGPTQIAVGIAVAVLLLLGVVSVAIIWPRG
jgi:pSer/pThr/pTyr-binding forkhead associated (FHA) protein